MRSKTFCPMVILGSLLLVTSCSESGSGGKCEKDGDCPQNWICDTYGKFCRCINDQGCNAVAGERCMPDGTCQVFTGCKEDWECGSCHRCDVGTGECLCTEDCGCAQGEVCNASGYCQPSSGCFDNQDCADSEICNITTKTCIPATSCTTKFQCPLGQICTGGSCVSGCEDYGDCPFKQACVQGSCVEGICQDDSFCDFIEYCGGNSVCQNAYNDQYAPFCKQCTNRDWLGCGQLANPCLIYQYQGDAFDQAFPANWRNTDGSANYCGVDCSGGQHCPYGFDCNQIITVPGSCKTDAECPTGIPCLGSQEEDLGFCPCNEARNPCPSNTCLMDSCGLFTRTCWALSLGGVTIPCTQDSDCHLCVVTRNRCNTNADCVQINCVPFEGLDYGACPIGNACGLLEGFHCPPP